MRCYIRKIVNNTPKRCFNLDIILQLHQLLVNGGCRCCCIYYYSFCTDDEFCL